MEDCQIGVAIETEQSFEAIFFEFFVPLELFSAAQNFRLLASNLCSAVQLLKIGVILNKI